PAGRSRGGGDRGGEAARDGGRGAARAGGGGVARRVAGRQGGAGRVPPRAGLRRRRRAGRAGEEERDEGDGGPAARSGRRCHNRLPSRGRGGAGKVGPSSSTADPGRRGLVVFQPSPGGGIRHFRSALLTSASWAGLPRRERQRRGAGKADSAAATQNTSMRHSVERAMSPSPHVQKARFRLRRSSSTAAWSARAKLRSLPPARSTIKNASKEARITSRATAGCARSASTNTWYSECRESRKMSRCAATSATAEMDAVAAARARSKRAEEEDGESEASRAGTEEPPCGALICPAGRSGRSLGRGRRRRARVGWTEEARHIPICVSCWRSQKMRCRRCYCVECK
ncbi:hypothetical protein PVAP13_5NG630001, partial [Panicum virgatum]